MGLISGLIRGGLSAAGGQQQGSIEGEQAAYDRYRQMQELARVQALAESSEEERAANIAEIQKRTQAMPGSFEESLRTRTDPATIRATGGTDVATIRATASANASKLKYQGLIEKFQNDQTIAKIRGGYTVQAARERAKGTMGAASIRAGAVGGAAHNVGAVNANLHRLSERAKEIAAEYPNADALAQALQDNPSLATELSKPVQVDPTDPASTMSLRGAVAAQWQGEGDKTASLGVKALGSTFDPTKAVTAVKTIQAGFAPAAGTNDAVTGGSTLRPSLPPGASASSPVTTTPKAPPSTQLQSPVAPPAAPRAPSAPAAPSPIMGTPQSPGVAGLNLQPATAPTPPVSSATPAGTDFRSLVLQYASPHGITEADLPASLAAPPAVTG